MRVSSPKRWIGRTATVAEDRIAAEAAGLSYDYLHRVCTRYPGARSGRARRGWTEKARTSRARIADDLCTGWRW
eukprot:scaffold278527_cov26-Tisochrysis_lutea.AAC.3